MKKLFTLLTLLLCAVVGVKGAENVLFTADFSDSSVWGDYSASKSITSGSTIGGMYFKCESSVQNNQLVIEGGNIKTSNYWISIPVTGVNGSITVKVTAPNSIKMIAMDGTAYTNNYTGEAVEYSLTDGVAVYTYNTTSDNVILYFGRGGSTRNKINSIVISTPDASVIKLSTPSITVNSANGQVTIGSVVNATKVTYTTDGSDPTDESNVYTDPFIAEDGVTVKAVAIGDGVSYANSDVASELVLRDDVVISTPVINQFNGTVALTCETQSATIEYSLNGIDYTTYTRAFTLTEDATVYARAKRNANYSDVVNAAVTTISKGAATKTIWMGHGSFDNNTTNSMTGKAGDDAENIVMTISGNPSKTWSSGSMKINIGGVERTTIKLSNGAQNTITLPAGLKATRITFYSVINANEGSRTSYWKEFQGTNINADVPMGAWNGVGDRLTNPDVRVFSLNGDENEITFTNAGEQLLFIIALDVLESETITVGAAGWATTVTAKALDFSGITGLTAYTAKLAGNKVTLSEAGEVPAGTALVLKGDEGTYSVPVIASAAAVEDNDLLGSATAATTMDANNTYYGLKVNGEGKAQFAKVTGESIPAGKAYLMVAGASARSFFDIDEDVTTAINSVAEQQANGEVYNLQGQRVKAATKGLYIVNGKKVVIK